MYVCMYKIMYIYYVYIKYVYIYMYVYIHTYANSYTYTYTYTYTYPCCTGTWTLWELALVAGVEKPCRIVEREPAGICLSLRFSEFGASGL